MQGQLDKLDEGSQAEIIALINQGEYNKAANKIAELTAAKTLHVTIEAALSAASKAAAASLKLPGWGGTSAVITGAPTGPTVTPMAPTATVAAPITTHVTVNLPAGSTPSTTLAAIRRYQRLGGDMGGLLDTVAAIR
jgi:hypothetical protein